MAQIRAVLTVAILVSAAHPAFARDMLVSDQAQFKAAVKKAQPGDAIILADGEWRDLQMVFTGTGTAAKPITLTVQTKGKVPIAPPTISGSRSTAPATASTIRISRARPTPA